MFVRGIAELSEAFVSIKRLQEYLLNEEFVSAINNTKESSTNSDTMISVQDFTAKWNCNSTENTLTNINLIIPKGNLVGIIGPVGSGKSSLLQAILSMYPLRSFDPLLQM